MKNPDESSAATKKIDSVVAKHRDALLAELQKIDPNLVLEISAKRPGLDITGHFSDWHDNWRDGPVWSKTWGKAGDKLAPIDIQKVLKK